MCDRGALLHFGAPVLRFAVSITRSFSLLPKFIALVQTMKATCSGRSVHQALSFAGSQAFFTTKTIVSLGRWDVVGSFARISLRTMSEWNAHYLGCSPLFSNKHALHSSELVLSITFFTSQLAVPSINFFPFLNISSKYCLGIVPQIF